MTYALEGLKIVDFGIFFAGPYASKLLADLGAEAIKVEQVTGDPLRRSPGPFNGCQRNKRAIALDLRTEEGKVIAHKLMAEADVVTHNMRPGVAERLGIDYQTAKGLREDIIYLYSPAFGTVGLSSGITSALSQWGQIIVILAMFIGRLGPYTIGIAMAQTSAIDNYRFVQERVTIG